VGKLKNSRPKIICSLEFSLVTFFVSDKESNIALWQAKEPNEVNSPKANEHK
jgi:hypothetical protein